MRRYIWPVGFLVMLLIGMGLAFGNALQDVQADVTPPPLPLCDTHTVGMTLTTSSLTPNVGEHLLVTVTLGNEGCGMIGLPQYRLSLTQPARTLAPETPEAITHYIGLNPGETDIVTFTLDTIGVGTVSLNAAASFEVHLGYPGPAYWAAAATGPLTVTIPPTDTEIVVFQQAAYDLGCFPSVERSETTYSFRCLYADVLTIQGWIERFADEATAQATFFARQGSSMQLEPFYCYSAYIWVDDLGPLVQGNWQRWVAERWIISVNNTDFITAPIAPTPEVISQAILQAALRNRLFLACYRQYLPIVCKK